eukprot:scaffold31235_cov17-Tisochrysis_lutea.AAC.1
MTITPLHHHHTHTWPPHPHTTTKFIHGHQPAHDPSHPLMTPPHTHLQAYRHRRGGCSAARAGVTRRHLAATGGEHKVWGQGRGADSPAQGMFHYVQAGHGRVLLCSSPSG